MSVAGFEYDLGDLLAAFSELLPFTNEELGQYWFRYNRTDGFGLTLSMCVYEQRVGIILRSGEKTLASLELSACVSVRVIRQDQGDVIEIRGSCRNPDSRCCISLDGDWLIQFVDASPS